jgi:hypothetical protein
VTADMSEPDRLPPPPFRRTRVRRVGAPARARPDRDPPRDVAPGTRLIQRDCRIRLYGYAASLGCYLSVVLLSDGETVHDAFPDEGYEP